MSPLLLSKLLDVRDRRRKFLAALRDLSYEFVKLKGDESEKMRKGELASSRISSGSELSLGYIMTYFCLYLVDISSAF